MSFNRANDLRREQRVHQYMTAIYKQLCYDGYWHSFEQEDNKIIQMAGVDVAVRDTGENILLLDEKCALDYWDKDLQTFAIELYTNNTMDKLGWFLSKSNCTTHYVFIWIKSDDAALTTNVSLEYAIVSKEKIKHIIGLTNESLLRVVDIVRNNPYVRHYVNGYKVSYSWKLREKPINVLIPKHILIDNAQWHGTYKPKFNIKF